MKHPIMDDAATRLAIRQSLEASGCMNAGYLQDGFVVAIQRGKFGAVNKWAKDNGATVGELAYFPLGSDTPPMEYRHDSVAYGIPNCNWLYAHVRFIAA